MFSPFTSYSKRHSSIFLDYRVLDITFLAFTHTQTRLVVQKLQVYTRDLIFLSSSFPLDWTWARATKAKIWTDRVAAKKNVPHERHGKLGLFQSCWGFGAHWIASVNHRMKMMKKKETNITLFPFLSLNKGGEAWCLFSGKWAPPRMTTAAACGIPLTVSTMTTTTIERISWTASDDNPSVVERSPGQKYQNGCKITSLSQLDTVHLQTATCAVPRAYSISTTRAVRLFLCNRF